MRFLITAVASLALALAAFGQINATTLGGKYGPPLKSYAPGSAEKFRPGKGDVDLAVNYANAEIFKVRSNIEMLVNYATSGQVCRIDLPRREPGGRQTFTSTDAESTRQLHEVLDEVVPSSIRGKALGGGVASLISFTEYENLTIIEVAPQTSITVKFNDEGCSVQAMVH